MSLPEQQIGGPVEYPAAPGFWDTVRLLGRLLGQVIERDRGHDFLDRIETIRALAKAARNQGAWTELHRYLAEIPSYEVTDVARAFNQFLNLANIAEQDYQVRNLEEDADSAWAQLFDRLSAERAVETVASMRVELVLTPHPTEVLRRTLMLKYDAIAAELKRRQPSTERLERLIAEAWHTEEIPNRQPQPQDDARWGFAVVENSLWEALPACLRDIDEALVRRNLPALPADSAPVAVASWLGGDRDGNPEVNARVTREVLMLARWMAADLYLRDIETLQADLSMAECNGPLRKRVGDDPEPYRALLRTVRERLLATRAWAETLDPEPPPGVYHTAADLFEPLALCDTSLRDVGMEIIADGPLKDTLRRVKAFGVTLVNLDVRQSADRHTAVLDEITRYLGAGECPGGYADWTEAERCKFLLDELRGRRPLFPAVWPVSAESREVLDTCVVVAEQNGDGISEYIVSKAKSPSDVLAVVLLLGESGLRANLPVVPLFETLDDLDRAAQTVDTLQSIPWYAQYAGGEQQVMLGYSDSAKDAGQMAASWALYQAKERLAEVAASRGVRLTLFHGRGSAVGRGRVAAQAAILAQPPNTVGGRLRVTEQGEAIRFKLGDPALARETLMRYLIGTIEASLDPPAAPTARLRATMSQLADRARASYRALVDQSDFVDYFRQITPQEELETLALGSDPTHRSIVAGISDMSAIPWVFAWTQVRLMLPMWLGTDAALGAVREDECKDRWSALMEWPFFRVQMDALEAVLAKTDLALVDFYAERLTPKAHRAIHDVVRRRATDVKQNLLTLRRQSELLADNPKAQDSIRVRNTYLDPLHLLQAELIGRLRENHDDQVAQALKFTMAGIASGLRHTG